MNIRLLSFLSDFENALRADDPAPADGGNWECVRTVNYQLGLARLSLTVRTPTGGLEPRGTVMLQFHSLADGTPCLKASINWSGCDERRTIPIFSKPGVEWRSEARKTAAEWMAGPPAQFAKVSLHEEHEQVALAV